MATTPIVTEVTKEELDALVTANGLKEGLQYKVTDKNWLLMSTGNNTLITVNGELTINNGDDVPEFISTNILNVDSGLIIGDYTESYFQIEIPSSYFPSSVKVTNNLDGSISITATQNIDLFSDVFFDPMKTSLYSSFYPSIAGSVFVKGFISLENEGVRCVFKCEK